MTRLLERIGLGRPELRAWAMYDWANSAFQTTVIAAVFPIYFKRVAAAALQEADAMARFAWATTIAIFIVAIVAPGARRDRRSFGGEEAPARGLRRHRHFRMLRDVLDHRRRMAVCAGTLRDRQCRSRRQHRLLRIAPAAHRRARRSSTGCPRLAMPSATSAAACCWLSIC